MRYLTIEAVLELHRLVLAQSGGQAGIRDRGALESAVAQPTMTFAGVELYPTLAKKAAALAFSLIQNHPFVDGNKRVGHAAMEVMLVLNGFEIEADIDEQEQIILAVAASQMPREEFEAWLEHHLVPLEAHED